MYPHMYPKDIDAVNLLSKPFSGCGNHSSPIFSNIGTSKALDLHPVFFLLYKENYPLTDNCLEL